jgi:uncharacterized RDD family membrane protein YckC
MYKDILPTRIIFQTDYGKIKQKRRVLSVEYEPAGFLRRTAAFLCDACFVGIILNLFKFATEIDLNYGYREIVIIALYDFLLPLWWNGYTVGKRLLGIRIVKVDGTSLDLKAMFLRAIVVEGILTLLTFAYLPLVSLVMVIVRRDKRAVHDLLAGTYVIKESRAHAVGNLQLSD